ncbi:hypothetical protein BDZ89DRAFT_1067231 [Hymenopellis radicata]|nr:hypothetical protein BDZ89DRAFT_1067231 [Hymenopellis radicata]
MPSSLFNTARALASAEQLKVLDENYGHKNKECKARVKAMYEELRLRDVYVEYEKKVYAV